MTNFHLLITDWYRQNKRDLPWRNTTDPYKIWLSEIILQQTRVDQGLSYYLKFVNEFATVHELAKASEQEVLALWQGLGYYSRARNLHSTAKTISNELNGQFPDSFDSLKKLKGIGDYTAAAIASFSFNETTPVVDGNVYRVLSRVFDIETPIDSSQGKKRFNELASELISKENPGEYNQSIMEFGALQCTPVQPNCANCVLSVNCLALSNNTIALRPVKAKKTKIKNRYFHYVVLGNENEIVLQKRIEKDIWQHLYQFPLTETDGPALPKTLNFELNPNNAISVSEEYIHILSHQKIHARFYKFEVPNKKLDQDYEIVNFKDLHEYPLPRLIDKFFEKER
ncbi:MAG: A/G-specific adenine glycosylase [Flavobacteriia bacterium]|jgi:A/G-specific adenine glycosylase